MTLGGLALFRERRKKLLKTDAEYAAGWNAFRFPAMNSGLVNVEVLGELRLALASGNTNSLNVNLCVHSPFYAQRIGYVNALRIA